MDKNAALNTTIEDFRRHLAVARSAATAKTYGVALTHLAAYAKMEGVETVSEVHPGHYMGYLKEGRSPVSLSSYMTALSQFAEYAHDEGLLLNGDYLKFKARLRRVRGQRQDRKIPDVPPEETFQALMEEARAERGSTPRQALMRLRNIALMETLRSTGCRVAEVVGLRRSDLADGRALVTGKGSKMRIVFFDATSWDAVTEYLDRRGDTAPSAPVFARHDRLARGITGISTTSVRNLIDTLAKRAGIDPAHVSPHKFRHRFGTTVLEASGNLAAVQDLMGHSNPSTTRIYARLGPDVLSTVHDGAQL